VGGRREGWGVHREGGGRWLPASRRSRASRHPVDLRSLVRIARGYVGNVHTAEDVVQDGCLEYVAQIPRDGRGLGEVSTEQISERAQMSLVEAFREWSSLQPPDPV
jgi:hypothetical protein